MGSNVNKRWQNRGRGRDPLFLDHTEAKRAGKIFLEIVPPPPLSQGLDDRGPPLTEGLDLPLTRTSCVFGNSSKAIN